MRHCTVCKKDFGDLSNGNVGMTVCDECLGLNKSGWWDVPDAEYYADASAVSHSMLEIFRQSIPLYAGRFVTRTIPADEPTAAMAFGTLFHTAILEPKVWEKRIVEEKIDGRTNVGKAQKARLAEFKAANPLVPVLTSEDESVISGMRTSCLAHGFLSDLLSADGTCEKPYRWKNARTSLHCKCKADKVIYGAEVVLDLKTTDNPSPKEFSRAIVNFGYGRQCAWYLDGIFPDGNGEFVFAAVGKKPPYEVVCCTLGKEEINLYREQNEGDLKQLAFCMEKNNWQSRWPELEQITLPPWAFKD